MNHFHGIIVTWFWVFKYIVGVLDINAWLWFSYVLVMYLHVLMVVWKFGFIGMVSLYLVLVLEILYLIMCLIKYL